MELLKTRPEDKVALEVLRNFQSLLKTQISASPSAVRTQAKKLCRDTLMLDEQLRTIFDDEDAQALSEDFVSQSASATCDVTSDLTLFSQLEGVISNIISVAEGTEHPLFRAKHLEPLFKMVTANKTDDMLRKFATQSQSRFFQPDKVTTEPLPSGQKLRLSHDSKVGWKIAQVAKKAIIAQGTILFKASGILNTIAHSRMSTALTQDVLPDTQNGVPVATQCELVQRQSSGWARMVNPLGLCHDDKINYLLLDCHDVGGINRYISV
jgi:hypothetical protein